MAKEPSHDKARGKTAKTPKPVQASGEKQFNRKAEEAKLVEKYPDRKIVAGSLRDSGEVAEFGQKRSIEIRCEETDKKFRIATSDLHQVRFHPDHMRAVRLARRKQLRAAKKKGKKAPAPKAVKSPKAPAAKKPAAKKTVKTTKPVAVPAEPVAAAPETAAPASTQS